MVTFLFKSESEAPAGGQSRGDAVRGPAPVPVLISLRFLAAFTIVLFHAWALHWLSPNFFGEVCAWHAVSFFFILSGLFSNTINAIELIALARNSADLATAHFCIVCRGDLAARRLPLGIAKTCHHRLSARSSCCRRLGIRTRFLILRSMRPHGRYLMNCFSTPAFPGYAA